MFLDHFFVSDERTMHTVVDPVRGNVIESDCSDIASCHKAPVTQVLSAFADPTGAGGKVCFNSPKRCWQR